MQDRGARHKRRVHAGVPRSADERPDDVVFHPPEGGSAARAGAGTPTRSPARRARPPDAGAGVVPSPAAIVPASASGRRVGGIGFHSDQRASVGSNGLDLRSRIAPMDRPGYASPGLPSSRTSGPPTIRSPFPVGGRPSTQSRARSGAASHDRRNGRPLRLRRRIPGTGPMISAAAFRVLTLRRNAQIHCQAIDRAARGGTGRSREGAEEADPHRRFGVPAVRRRFRATGLLTSVFR
ncbi:hypothetical protein QO001_001701 [Methylobacterium brachiatum]|jgi:hypothetical protein|uniref:Uncharacterized protein n=1 Tax=Methylobacterium brachiatum TaxID=269660 RepID=A0AAJ1TRH0_9HYPH|nr:hypothetical protein [Methylobacterium brachiatum]SFV15562.1 hypothetical protein SAMN02799643_06338 [Methylobacterium sp. UNCCL125]